MTTGGATLSCEELTVRIGSRAIVESLNLRLQPGEYWGMLGANGAGKTTLLRHLAGLVTSLRGTVSLNGNTLDNWPRRALARHLGMLQQHTAYVFDATVLEVALTGRHPYLGVFSRESAEDLQRARAATGRVDLGALEQRRVTSLSGGEARRLAFAALLVQDPDVLLLDEPTNHLDFRHQVGIMRTVGDLVYREGRCAAAALHDVNLAATYCSHVLLLFGDGEWEAGKAADLLTVDRLERLYQCPVTSVETDEGRRFHPSFSGARTAAASRS
jgi:iron complex transport system ATP-binding protein